MQSNRYCPEYVYRTSNRGKCGGRTECGNIGAIWKELVSNLGIGQAFRVQDLYGILKRVSRSFYLSMKFLPLGMREPIGLAYLMARASDTIADEALFCPQRKLELLQAMQEGEFAYVVEMVRQEDDLVMDAEGGLLQRVGEVADLIENLAKPVREHVKLVTKTIIEGQMTDVQRFEVDVGRVDTEKEVEEYCYAVAGCVGEFWTRVGFFADSGFSLLPKRKLEHMGREFGIGLQLVNILRDAPRDLAENRQYLPEMQELDKEIAEPWIARAEAAMEVGMEYADSLKRRVSRMSVYLPASIGIDTIALVRSSAIEKWEEGLKVRRSVVYRELIAGLLRSKPQANTYG